MKEFNDFLDNDLKVPYHWKRMLYDKTLSLVLNRPALNIGAFDDYLHSFFRDYENRGYSMEEVLNEVYPQETVKKIRYYLGV